MKTSSQAQSVRRGRSMATLPVVRRARLADVAKKAGVNSATASQVLNDRANCCASDATRQRIRKAVEDLGYRPNLTARALRSGKTHVIGLVAPGFIVNRAGGLTEAAAKADYTVTVSSHHNDSASEDLVITRLLDRGVDGLAIYPVDTGPHRELRRLVQSGFPVITFDGASLLDFECDDISVDYAALGKRQAQHLLGIGRRRICIANAIPEARINAIRETAIRNELKQAGAPAPLEMRLNWSTAREVTESGPLEAPMRAFIEKHRGAFDGVIGFDAMASLTIRVLQELSLRVPEDAAVVGAGNTMLASYGSVQLTSVSTADDAAGIKAFGLLMDQINGSRNGPYRRLTSPAKLIVRKSSQG